jgi:5'-methylthioadenosine phosphorylase
MNKVGIIGGSGLDDPNLLQNFEELEIETPYGKPASKITKGTIAGKEVFILARHGKGHTILPTNVPFRANIWALKELGCTQIIATTACGSLQEQIAPEDFVILDQFIDFTKKREYTFFTDKVVHTPMAEPFDFQLRSKVVQAADELGYKIHKKGTVITIEGPRFSTKAESNLFRSWGADVINMSTVPEITLANELKLPYCSIAMATDYDCWKQDEESVTMDLILKRMQSNSDRVKKLITNTLKII